MIANSRLYLLIFAGIVPLALVGVIQLTYSLITPGSYIFKSFEPFIVSLTVLYNILLLIIVLLDLLLSIRKDEIAAGRVVNEKLSIKRLNPVTIDLSNFSAQELIAVIKDDTPQIEAIQLIEDDQEAPFKEIKAILRPGTKGSFTYYLKPRKRGDYRFENINIKYLSRFRLFWKIAQIKADEVVEVYPDLIQLKELSFKLTLSAQSGEIKIRKFGEGTEFSSLREYYVGDDVRHIDWKATARRDYPILKTYEASRDQTVLVLVDAGRMMSTELAGITKFDWALNATLAVSMAALHKGDNVGVGVFSDKPKLFIPPKKNKTHLKKIIESIHNLQPEPIEPDYVGMLSHFASLQKKRALIIVITDLVDTIASKTLLNALSHLAKRHLPFCVTYNDKSILDIANTQITTPDDIYRQSVALDLLESRKQALNVIVRKGGLILDTPPEHLSDDIIDKYLMIKAKSLI